jgi:hypothetical protein
MAGDATALRRPGGGRLGVGRKRFVPRSGLDAGHVDETFDAVVRSGPAAVADLLPAVGVEGLTGLTGRQRRWPPRSPRSG